MERKGSAGLDEVRALPKTCEAHRSQILPWITGLKAKTEPLWRVDSEGRAGKRDGPKCLKLRQAVTLNLWLAAALKLWLALASNKETVQIVEDKGRNELVPERFGHRIR